MNGAREGFTLDQARKGWKLPVLLIYIIISTKVRHDIRLSPISEEKCCSFLGS
jgi:hypothetical protein